jgi:hypothetical protein
MLTRTSSLPKMSSSIVSARLQPQHLRPGVVDDLPALRGMTKHTFPSPHTDGK